jgi:multiple sugar transport system ATP-binding protein
VAQLVGSPKINLLRANATENKLSLEDSDLRLPLDAICDNGDCLPDKFIMGIRPEDVRLAGAGLFGGEVMLVEPLGVETLLHIQVGGQTVVSTVSGMSQVKRGENVRFNLLQDRLHFFNPASGERL